MPDHSDVPLFDSLTHPTPTGAWLHERYGSGNTVKSLLGQMEANNVRWAFTVGMQEVGGYEEATYAAYISGASDALLPVAFLSPVRLGKTKDIEDYLSSLVNLGYRGIKIHPRHAKITLDNPGLPEAIAIANRLGLVVLLCTYFWESSSRACRNNMTALHELLAAVPHERVILLHGGAVRLMECLEMARTFRNVLLDVSFTLCKYAGSSLDFDIKYVFKNFDRRTCVGSDSPEFSLDTFRERFNFFAGELPKEKVENIAYRNLVSHLESLGHGLGRT